jgi:hypothetical protein
MSMSVNLHSRVASKFEVSTKISTTQYHDGESYPIITISATPEGTYDYQEVSLFPSFEQVKKLRHKKRRKGDCENEGK